MKKNASIVLLFLFIANNLFAQLSTVSYTTAGSTYSQTFDGLSSSSNVNLFNNGGSINSNPLGPYDLSVSPTSVAGLAGWQVYKIAGNTAANTTLTLGLSNGGSSSGNFYNLGATLSSDRALGLLNASTLSTAAIGVVLTNTTGSTLTSFSVAFTAEQWRQNSATNTFTFKYAMGSGSSFNDISTPTTFTTASTGSFSNPNTGTPTNIDGNATANQVAKSFTISNITWNNGDKLVLRWESVTATNNNAIGIDNFSFSANNTSSNIYLWNGSTSTDYQVAANWTPNRISRLSNDSLQFTTSATVTNVPSETISGLLIGGTSTIVSFTPATSSNVLTLNSGLNIAATNALNVNTLSLAGGFTTTGTGALNTAATGNTPLPVGTTFTMDVNYNSTSAQTIVAGNYNNLTISGNRTTNNITLAASGTIAIAASFSNTAQFSTGGGYVVTGSTINYSGTGAQSIIAFNYNNLTISGVRTGNVTLASSGTIGVAGLFSTTATFSSGNYVNTGSTIDFNGSGNQTNAIASFTYNNLSITNSGTKSAGSSTITMNANGVLTVASGTTFDLLTRQLSGTTLTTAGTGLLKTANTSSNALPVDITWTMDVEYNSTVANQTVQRGVYNNLTISGARTTFSVTLASGTTTIGGVFNPSATFTNATGNYLYNNTNSTIAFNSTAAQSIPAFNYNNLTITGTRIGSVTLASSGTIGVAGTFSATGLSFTSGTVINTGSTINFNGTTAQSAGGGSAFTFNNLTISNTTATVSATGTINLASSAVLNIANGATFDLATFVLTGAITTTGTGLLRTASLSGNPIPVDLTWTMDVEYYSTAGSQTIQRGVYNNLAISGARTSFSVTLASGITTIGGVFNPSATFSLGNNGYIFNTSTSTISFSSTNAQTIPAFNYNNLTITGARTNNNVTLASSGTIGVAGTFSTTSLSFTSGTVVNAGSTINFNGTVAQSVGGGTAFSYNNLTVSNTGATVTAAGTISLANNGVLNIANGATFDLATNVLTGAITTTGTGLLRIASLSNNPIPVDLTWTMDVEYYSTAGSQTIQRGVYNNLAISGARTTFNVTFPSLTTTIGGAFSPTATFTTGGYLYYNTNSTISFASTGAQTIPAFNYNNLTITGIRTTNNVTLASSGTIGVAGTFSTTSLSFTSGIVVNAGSTINFNGTTAQSVGGSAAFTFNNLTISNTAATVTATGTIGMASGGVLNIANGATFDMATYVLSGAITTSGNGLLRTASLSGNPIPVDLTWTMDVEYYSTAGSQTIQRGVYNNLAISGARTNFTVTLASGITTIGGVFNPSATFSSGNNGYIFNTSTSTISFSSTNTQTIPAFNYNNLTITGTRTSNNVTLASSGIIGVAGNFTVSATFSSGGFIVFGSTINLNGTTAQNIPAFTFNNLSLANSAGATLTGNETVNGTLTLTSGKLTLGNNNLTLSAGATINATTTNYIVTNGTGALIINSVGSTTFPVGTTSSYLPLSVANATNTPNITVAVKNTITNTPPNSNEVVNAEWSILSSTSSNADVTYQYNAADKASEYTGTSPVLGIFSDTYTESTLSVTANSNPFGVKAVGLSLPTLTKKLYVIGNNHAFVLVVASAPTNVTATFGDAQATVDFNAPSDNGGAIITGYTVTSNPGGITATGSGSPITVTGLTNGTTYTFTVVAINCQGASTASIPSNSVTLVTVPSAPISVSAVGGIAQTTISFTAPASNGGSSILDYTITAIPSSGGNIVRTGITSSPYPFTGLTNGITYTFTVAARNVAGTGATITSNAATPSSTTTWNGSSWSNGTPTLSTDAVVNGNLTIGTLLSSKSLTVNSGYMVVNNSTLTINGAAFVNNGTISGSGTTVLGGSATQTVSGTGTVANFTLNNSAGATISNTGTNKLNVTGILTVTSGTLATTTNGNLTLKSTSITNTAVVATGGVSGSNVTVERFIPMSLRAYRDLSPGVTTSGSIFANWQEGGASPSGYGTYITGAVGSSAGQDANGFDNSYSGNKSLYQYVGGVWSAVANTNITLSYAQPYRILIRGDRTFNIFTTPQGGGDPRNGPGPMQSPTVLRATGTLFTGTYSPTLNSTVGGFTMLANPYVCPIDWSTVTKANIGTSYWYLDPTIGNANKYVVYNANTGTNNNPLFFSDSSNIANGTTSTGSNVNQYIQPGQAFFVRTETGGSPSLTIQETDKAPTSPKTAVFDVAEPLSKIAIGLLKQSTTSTAYRNMDGAVVAFKSSFSNGLGDEDSRSLKSANDNLSIVSNNDSLSIEGRQPVTEKDTIALLATGLDKTLGYRLRIDASSYAGNGVAPYLYDSYKNTVTALNTNSVNTIDFAVDANAASSGQRFSLVFKPTVLAVNSIVVAAKATANGVQVNWNTVGEHGAISYEVERSTNGISFSKQSTVAAKNTATASYSYTDGKPVSGDNYYRIKAIGTTGVNYSQVVLVKVGGITPSLVSVFPNPIVGSQLNVAFSHVAASSYQVSLHNSVGQQVFAGVIKHAGGTANVAVNLGHYLPAGSYEVAISDAAGKVVYHTQLAATKK